MARKVYGSVDIVKDVTASKANIDNLTMDDNAITSTNADGDINLTPNNDGNVVLDGLKYPQSDGTLGQILTTDAASQISWKTQQIVDQEGYTFDPNGFDDPNNEVTVSFNDGTRTLTISPKVSTFKYWSEGQVYIKSGAESIVIDNTEGVHYAYYNGSTLSKTAVWDDDLILKYAIVALIYWDPTSSKQIFFGDEFKHTTKMSSKTHQYLHNTVGFALQSGGNLTDILADESGNLNSHAQFGVEATVAFDEDAQFSFTARGSTENIPIYYKSGTEAAPIWHVNEGSAFGVLTTGTGRAAYNYLTGGNWTQTEVSDKDFVLAHVFTYNDSTRKFGLIQGEVQYTDGKSAQAGALTEISNLVLDRSVTPEVKFLGTIIFETKNGFTNAVKSRIVSTDSGADYVDLRDFRFTAHGATGSVVDHGSLSGLSDDDHLQYLLADGTRTLSGVFTQDDISVGYTGSNNVTKQIGLQTTDATPTDLVQIAIAEEEMLTLECRINGFKSDYSASIGASIFATFRRSTGGSVAIVGSPIINICKDATGTDITVVADTVNQEATIQATGIAAETYNFTCTYMYHKTISNA